MKKHLRIPSLLLALVMAFSLFPASAMASESDYLLFFQSYEEHAEVTLCLVSSNGNGAVEIPNEYDGKPVTRIADSAFKQQQSMTSVTIPDSVTSIGSNAFILCTGLTNITIPHSVTSIEDGAFAFCFGLESISFEGDAPEIGENAFLFDKLAIHYPVDNPTWTEEVKQNYGATAIDWGEPSHVHDFGFGFEEHAPTCTEQGYYTSVCVECGEAVIIGYLDPLGHDYLDGTCTRCGEADPDYVKPAESSFSDVPADSFYAAPVLWALENGITTGTSDSTFSPNDQCLRSHVVTFLWRAEKSPEPSSTVNSFTDVKTGDFFYKPVLWAVENNITTGISSTEFGSYDVCNRAAVVTFLWRAAGKPEPVSTDNPFTDVKTTDFYYKPVLWALENGITTGLSPTEFGAAAPCNRAQVVTFLYRVNN